ncbi:UROD/MetE-like protein [Peniophora sp. CONT]|nr:UROD/MetE-like protein [Peniophora sp. CONT]
MSPQLKQSPPFRAEHLGSLKRPAYLLRKREQFDKGEISHGELVPVEREAIQSIVKMQKDVGLHVVSDGEFARHMFFDGVFDNLEGMKHIADVPTHMFMEYVPDVAAFINHESFKKADSYICTGKLKRTKPFYLSQFETLKSFVPPKEHGNIKMTMCAPEWFHLRHGPYAFAKEAYATDEEYFADVAKAYQEEIQALYEIGCRNIQFDDPLLAYFCAESMIKGMEKKGVDHERLLQLYIDTYNDCLKGRPADMNVGIHLCRGNFKDGMHFSEGGYDRIAVKLFNELNVDCYYLEYDTERAGTFEPLKHLPKHKMLVLGLITSKFPQLEDPETIKQRVHAAAEVISQGVQSRSKDEALNQLCISPQCGFASHEEGNNVTEEDMVNKLRLVVQIAKDIWPSQA